MKCFCVHLLKPCVVCALLCFLLLISCVSTKQPPTHAVGAASHVGNVDVWKNLYISNPIREELGKGLSIGSIQFVNGNYNNARLAFSTDGQNTVDRVSSNVTIVDLSQGFSHSTSAGTGKINPDYIKYQFESNSGLDDNVSYHSYVEGPIFSPDGHYISLGLMHDFSSYYPFILNTKEKSFHGLLVSEQGHKFAPLCAGKISWSPDSNNIAYFDPNESASGEMKDELSLIDETRVAYVQDWRSNTRLRAVNAQGTVSPLSWLNARTLLYGALPYRKRRYNRFDAQGHLPRPNVYGYDIYDKKTFLIVKDGYRPSPSPNGSYIVFFGSREPDHPQRMSVEENNPFWKWRYFCSGASLCISKYDGSHRIALQSYYGLYPLVQWLPDSKRFVLIECVRSDLGFQAKLTLWDVETQNFSYLTTLYASDNSESFSLDPFTAVKFPFSSLGTSPDGTKVFIAASSLSKLSGPITSTYLPNSTKIYAVDVTSGETSVVASLKNPAGFDVSSIKK